jgi:hypothetical protein
MKISHLCDLVNKLATEVDLWVIQGKGHVWPTFNQQLTRWILTPQLSRQNLNRGVFDSFHKVPRAFRSSGSTTWLTCDSPEDR